MSNTIQRYGWKRDRLDKRDIKFKVAKPTLLKLPTKVDLRDKMPGIYDQETLGSCTANAIGGACHYEDLKEGKVVMPSRLFVYYNTRVLEGTVPVDSGAELRNTVKAINRWGYCDEKLWPYDVNRFTQNPGPDAYDKATARKIFSYNRVTQQIQYIKAALTAKHLVSFGFMVYPAFESVEVATSGMVPMPNPLQEDPIGGHAVVLVGYDDSKRQFTVRNSWGPGWGDGGYFYMPYKYVLDRDLSSDLWIITRIPQN